MQILENELMSKHTSFKVGGSAHYYVKAECINDIQSATALAREKGLPYFILGNGTNLLVSDKGFDGVVITLAGEFSEIVDLGNGAFKVGAATPLGRFARNVLKLGFAGIHKLAGIPGTLGGAIYMNAGAYGQEIGTCCTQVTVLDSDGNIREISNADCAFGYRQSIFQKDKAIILSATFQLPAANAEGKTVADLEAELAECMAKRKASQPLNMPNAGSTFKRLDKGSADMPQQIAPGYYIEQAGLKGYRIGGAEVSTVHANFIVNAGGATAGDIKQLSEFVQQKVAEKFGIQLKREIILLGKF
ncbi:UDP-N-acetylmuramate dehydrogenase [Fibrobacter sp. UWB10]|uniref:UDP-N-acetylmuramate dehydrogenase n=1 Tax=Fibrobacter sp. UWB10 TaxID=1896201 RepID=UPI00240338BD|nr:UDP-N-acetylmuramate dehydrogenase [Fibrobacter sp. UWB10]SMP44644.1 UDP-N-acetylmuramate dehydrogenase [Fibrobacter sp. UWB10]